ncbi:MAG: bifunctional UDP-N-acetylglucosamine diphosphorylase/glucosamine-1-phosphate N-acetyltransferase GlmU [Phycisphaerae bacterium]
MEQSAAIILAAGKSTRMQSELPKVLHPICGRPMLGFVLSACRLAGVDRLVVVVGHGREQVQEAFSAERDITWVEQTEQLGTGHAVQVCREALSGFRGSVVVVAGDMPLIQRETVAQLLHIRHESSAAMTMATTRLDDPTGYGRILRDGEGRLAGIIEHRDCDDEQLGIQEVNPSYYCFDSERLFSSLDALSPGSSGEIYLTDIVEYFRSQGQPVSAEIEVAAEDAMGINTRLALARVARVMQDRIQWGLMSNGVTIVDPDNAWIESDVSIGQDSVIYPFTFVGKGANIGEKCQIGPFAHIPAGETIADGEKVESTLTPGLGAR